MLDEFDRRAFPILGVFNVEVIAVEAKRKCHIAPNAGPLVALFEGVGLRDARQQSNREVVRGSMSSSP